MEIYLKEKKDNAGLTQEEIASAIAKSLEGRILRRVLILPPDITRYYSNAGFIAAEYYRLLTERGCEVDVLPALGTHEPMTAHECERMFPGVPYEKIIRHDWRNDVIRIGEIPSEFLSKITGGMWVEPIDAEVNRRVMDASYDLIISVGQVVPHEVAGMANYTKNIFVGVGGSVMINKSHMMGAVYGIERIMGRDYSPVRRMFDYAFENFFKRGRVLFALTITTAPKGHIITHGFFIGEERKAFNEAVALSIDKNINFVERGIKKCVVYLEPEEFKSTWLGNKAIYRTRMAIADGGELIILAPGVTRFGEDASIDMLIRKYGYYGKERILEQFYANEDLRKNMCVAAHLIHGSSDNRFNITYAVKRMEKREIAAVNFSPADYGDISTRYDHERLKYGVNIMPDGEEIYYIPNPALGLWINRARFSKL